MYKIVISPGARKELRKLEPDVRDRIIAVLKRCRIRPHTHMKRLVGLPVFALRVGDYRIITKIFQDTLIVLVIEVKNRKNVYK